MLENNNAVSSICYLFYISPEHLYIASRGWLAAFGPGGKYNTEAHGAATWLPPTLPLPCLLLTPIPGWSSAPSTLCSPGWLGWTVLAGPTLGSRTGWLKEGSQGSSVGAGWGCRTPGGRRSQPLLGHGIHHPCRGCSLHSVLILHSVGHRQGLITHIPQKAFRHFSGTSGAAILWGIKVAGAIAPLPPAPVCPWMQGNVL